MGVTTVSSSCGRLGAKKQKSQRAVLCMDLSPGCYFLFSPYMSIIISMPYSFYYCSLTLTGYKQSYPPVSSVLYTSGQ